MSWIAIFLGLILFLAGAGALAASIDLLTTELGLLYAVCGAVGVGAGAVTIAIGLMIRRIDALARTLRTERAPAARDPERSEPIAPALLAGIEPVILAEPPFEAADMPLAEEASEPAPIAVAQAQDAFEPAVETAAAAAPAPPETSEAAAAPAVDPPAPAPAPTLVGRYSAGGSDYSIFTDGSIEAQTSEGDFRFGSMREFKAFIAAKKG